jgi:hypothetical protein
VLGVVAEAAEIKVLSTGAVTAVSDDLSIGCSGVGRVLKAVIPDGPDGRLAVAPRWCLAPWLSPCRSGARSM